MKSSKQIVSKLAEKRDELSFRVYGTDADRLLNRLKWEREKIELSLVVELLDWISEKEKFEDDGK